MAKLSHSIARLSIGRLSLGRLLLGRLSLGLAAGGLAFASSAGLAEAPQSAPAARSAADPRSPYFGRWTVSGDKEVFSTRGRLYRTIDVAPCGRDFCGISVAANGTCGAVLFRFLARNQRAEMLRGHGTWGKQRKNITLEAYTTDEVPGGRVIDLNLGDGYDFGERSDNMPKFTANYRPVGAARCTRR